MTQNISSNTNLLKLKAFWFATLCPISLGIGLMCIISYLDGLGFGEWNGKNIQLAYDSFKIPLVIISLAFPLGAVVIANHRSQQTMMMADLQSSQNRFANYFLHLDRFKEGLKDTPFGTSFKSLRLVHDIIYPELLSDGVLEMDSYITTASIAVAEIDDKARNIIDEAPRKPLSNLRRDINNNGNWLNSLGTDYASDAVAYNEELLKYFSNNEVQCKLFDIEHMISTFLSKLRNKLKHHGGESKNGLASSASALNKYSEAMDSLMGFSGAVSLFKTPHVQTLMSIYSDKVASETKV
jgi:hypothetical protein